MQMKIDRDIKNCGISRWDDPAEINAQLQGNS